MFSIGGSGELGPIYHGCRCRTILPSNQRSRQRACRPTARSPATTITHGLSTDGTSISLPRSDRSHPTPRSHYATRFMISCRLTSGGPTGEQVPTSSSTTSPPTSSRALSETINAKSRRGPSALAKSSPTSCSERGSCCSAVAERQHLANPSTTRRTFGDQRYASDSLPARRHVPAGSDDRSVSRSIRAPRTFNDFVTVPRITNRYLTASQHPVVASAFRSQKCGTGLSNCSAGSHLNLLRITQPTRSCRSRSRNDHSSQPPQMRASPAQSCLQHHSHQLALRRVLSVSAAARSHAGIDAAYTFSVVETRA